MTKIDNRKKINYSLPISCLNMQNLSIRVFIECPRPEFGNTFQEETPRVSKMSHDFNLTYLVHFMCYLTSLTIQSALTTFRKPTVCAHKLSGCPLRDSILTVVLRKKQKTIAGVWVLRRASRGFWGFLFSFPFVFFL